MKFLHLADLHIGKRLNEFSLIEDQRYILLKILNIIDEEKPDGVLIAGDVYDKAVPSVEAVEVMNKFFNELAKRRVQTFIISGNHDSAERLSFARDLIDFAGIHISRAYNGEADFYELCDEWGSVKIHMLPFVKPVHVRQAFPDEEINSYEDAVRVAIDKMDINPSQRNILITHQFVTGASTCESEEISVGGSDNISADLFDDFDYVALGHIHSPQHIKRETLRYSGSPLKYSFSEASHQKSATLIDIKEKGNIEIKKVLLIPKYDMVEIRGAYNELMAKSYYENLNTDDYFHITLTDEEDIPDAISRLRCVYKKTMVLSYDNKRTRSSNSVLAASVQENKSPIDLIDELYDTQNGKPLDENQRAYALSLVEKIWEDD